MKKPVFIIYICEDTMPAKIQNLVQAAITRLY